MAHKNAISLHTFEGTHQDKTFEDLTSLHVKRSELNGREFSVVIHHWFPVGQISPMGALRRVSVQAASSSSRKPLRRTAIHSKYLRHRFVQSLADTLPEGYIALLASQHAVPDSRLTYSKEP